MKYLICAAAMTLALAGCRDPKGAADVLTAQGYTDVRAGGYAMIGCGDDDDVATTFTATGPSGTRVKGVVCRGFLFKGSTVRITGTAPAVMETP